MLSECIPAAIPRERAARHAGWNGRVAPAPQAERARDDEREAILLSIQPALDSLAAVAQRILGSHDLAWDAVQEALMSFWLVDPVPPNPRAWLIRTVTHRSMHLSRCRSRRRKHEERASLKRAERSDCDEPSRRLERQEVQQALDAALLGITPDHRDVLTLKWLAEMDYASISHDLQIPEGTVRSRLNRSREALRRMLLQTLPDEYIRARQGGAQS
jgi:RNA polymerase sigma-70 factor (ECF subfamily)